MEGATWHHLRTTFSFSSLVFTMLAVKSNKSDPAMWTLYTIERTILGDPHFTYMGCVAQG